MSDTPYQQRLSEAIKYLQENGCDFVDRYASLHPMNPHLQGAMPLDMQINCQRVFKNGGSAKNLQDAMVDLFLELHGQPNALSAARALLMHINNKFCLDLDIMALPAAHYTDQDLLKKFELFNSITTQVRFLYNFDLDGTKPEPLLVQEGEKLAEAVIDTIAARLNNGGRGSLYDMPKEDRDTLAMELSHFIGAHSETSKTSSIPYGEISRFKHYSHGALLNSYTRMKGCAGSEGYKYAVRLFFSQFLDALIAEQKKRVPEEDTARTR